MNLANEIRYHVEPNLSADEFIGVLEASTLAARRPVADRPCVAGMLAHADLIVTARFAARLVGVARSVTDFHYCCYLSDLAVDDRHQRHGIGTRLIRETQDRLRRTCRPASKLAGGGKTNRWCATCATMAPGSSRAFRTRCSVCSSGSIRKAKARASVWRRSSESWKHTGAVYGSSRRGKAVGARFILRFPWDHSRLHRALKNRRLCVGLAP